MGAASLEKRLSAARLCQDWGFLLGFHFDPVLMRPGWENGYRNVIKKIGTTVDARRIAWVSLGTLRFPPELKSRIQARFPGSSILGEEMIRGLDGKMRCLRPLRTEAYRKMAGWLKDLEPELFVYLCMESPAVWEQVFGESPSSNADLDWRFARSLWKRFPELEMEEPARD